MFYVSHKVHSTKKWRKKNVMDSIFGEITIYRFQMMEVTNYHINQMQQSPH